MPDDRRSVTYFWDVLAWRASRPVQRMTWAQRGMYREMLDEQRDKGSLPDCPLACAELLGGTEGEWLEAWPVLRRHFVDRRGRTRHGEQPHDPGDHNPTRRIVNLRMARTVREQKNYFLRQRENGKKGGLAKARTGKTLEASTATAPLEHRHGTALANPSDKNRLDKKRVEERESTRGLAYDGRILTVFKWQFAELGKRLAEQHREDFDLTGWLGRVEADIERTGSALPAEQADRWTWLLARFYRDAGLKKPSLTGGREESSRRAVPSADETREYLRRLKEVPS